MSQRLRFGIAVIVLLSTNPVFCAPALGPITAPGSAGLHQRFEATFEVSTVATNPFWPYDPNPAANTDEHPNAVPSGVGVSVDGLFLAPGESDWGNAIPQPAFSYQEYEPDATNPDRTLSNGSLWIHPVGSPVWKVRFAPKAVGLWRYKIRVVDAGGTTFSPEHTFECAASNSHGFVRVSPTDSRYFELSDGTFVDFIGAHTLDAPAAKNIGVNLVRVWWQSSNPTRALFGAGGQGGDLTWPNLQYDVANAPTGYLVCSKVPQNAAVWNSINNIVSVKPNTNYRFKARVKLVGLTGDGDCGLFLGNTMLNLKSVRHAGTMDWTWLSLDFSQGNGYEARVWLGTQSTTGGTAYVSDISLREDLGGGIYGPELLGRTDLQTHRSYHPRIAWLIDQDIAEAEENGIYLKVVTMEKGDTFFGCIQEDGGWGARADNNIYGSATHACRTYQTYYWRYLIARYGYSTAIHSFEMFNEADPFNGNHWNAVQAYADYVNAHDPNGHMVSTSNWHSFPALNWKQCASAAYTDLHMYMGWNIPSGGYRIFPGWDGPWYCPSWGALNGSSSAYEYAIDTAVSHSGRGSLKISLLPAAVVSDHYLPIGFVCGSPPGHAIKVSAWVKAQNVIGFPGASNSYLSGLYKQNGDDWCGWPSASLEFRPGTYDWEYVEVTFAVPNTLEPGKDGIPQSILYRPRVRPNNSAQPGYIWIDDLVVRDMTTGKVVNYNGGMEEVEPLSYDVVAGHCAYAKLAAGFQLGKPTIRGETGICHPQRYANPYKGFSKGEEDEALIDDVDHLWWKKLVWAQIYSEKLYELQWWSRNIGGTYAKAYLAFMSGIPLSNGDYVDIGAVVSNPDMRVLGQKNLTLNQAHIWIDNAPYTWKAVVDHNYSPVAWSSTATYALNSTCGSGSPAHIYKSLQNNNTNHPVTDTAWWQDMGAFNAADNPPLPPSASGTVTISGFADGFYKVEWWNTSTGVIGSTQEVQCTGGNIQLSVQNLVSDIACKIYPRPARVDLRVLVPSDQVIPGQVVTVTVEYTNNGESVGRNVEVSARVPALMDYVAGSGEQSGGVYSPLDQSITWMISQLDAGETGTKLFRAKVQ